MSFPDINHHYPMSSKLEQLDKKLHAISKLPKTSQAPAMVRFMLELCQPFTLARRERACVVLRHKS